MVYDLDRQYGIGFLTSLLPAHVSLKQPFSFESMELLEGYFDALAASIPPFTVELTHVYHARWGGYGILGLDVRETDTLRALHNRINKELGELFEDPSAAHDGEGYRFHLTIEMGKVEGQDVYQRYYDEMEDRSVNLSFTAREIVLAYGGAQGAGSFTIYKVLPLEGAPDSDEAIRRWDVHARELADFFDPDEGDPNRVVLLNPALFQILPDVAGKRVLDAGCGEGYLSRKLARLGARVTGVDYSQEQLAIAQERTDPQLGIEYRHGNCEHLDILDPGSFDVVVSNMVLMDLADHQAALKGFGRVLVEGGILVFSISHPCFAAPGHGWVRDGDGNKLHWKVDRYFSEGPYEQPMPPGTEHKLLLYHRTLSNYVRTLIHTGFELLDVVEPKPAEEMLARYPRFRDDLRMTHFIVFKAQKPARASWPKPDSRSLSSGYP
jgi:2-polyprenyl-3-methyl-5-hydroxy-6-metoxy-1,4-benzoquinol methylase